MKRLYACLSGLLVLTPVLLVLLVAGVPATTTTTTTYAEPALNQTGFRSLWHSWYAKATHLLDSVPHPSATTTTTTAGSAQPTASEAGTATAEAKVVTEIRALAEGLKLEEAKFEDLLEARAAIKRQSWTWFLDPHIRSQVDAASLAVNNQRRKVESLFDDISLHWRQLKPLHGVRSRMFVSELLAFLMAPVLSILDFVASAFSFGLLFFLLLLGPAALFLGMFAFSMGVAMLPMISACLVVLYTLEFPWLIIQYNPSALEFIVAYAPFLLATSWLVSSITRALRPVRQQFRYAISTAATTPTTAPPAVSRSSQTPSPSSGSRRRATNVKAD